jgi:hypothetical protein
MRGIWDVRDEEGGNPPTGRDTYDGIGAGEIV